MLLEKDDNYFLGKMRRLVVYNLCDIELNNMRSPTLPL